MDSKAQQVDVADYRDFADFETCLSHSQFGPQSSQPLNPRQEQRCRTLELQLPAKAAYVAQRAITKLLKSPHTLRPTENIGALALNWAFEVSHGYTAAQQAMDRVLKSKDQNLGWAILTHLLTTKAQYSTLDTLLMLRLVGNLAGRGYLKLSASQPIYALFEDLINQKDWATLGLLLEAQAFPNILKQTSDITATRRRPFISRSGTVHTIDPPCRVGKTSPVHDADSGRNVSSVDSQRSRGILSIEKKKGG